MAANTPPVATPQTIAVTMNVPVPVTLAAADAEGDVLTYAIVSAPFRGVLSGTPPNLIYTPSANFTGNDNFWFVAKDASRTSAPVSVFISLNDPANQPPTVALTSPSAGATFAAPATIQIVATAADADGSVTRVDFQDGLTLVGSATNPPYAFTWTGVPAGTHTLIAKAFDDIRARSYAVPVVVTVTGSSPAYTLAVTGGIGGGSYTAGTLVPISATIPAGKTFAAWTGSGVANATAANTVLQMPAANATVTAVFGGSTPPPTTYTLTVVGGTGGGAYVPGATVTVTAGAAPAGQGFFQWSGAAVASSASPQTTLVMPSANTTLTAQYIPLVPHALTVNGGTGGGTYMPGVTVGIAANPPVAGLTFDRWTGSTVRSTNSPATVLVMPASNAVVTATYRTLPPPAPVAGISNAILFVTQVPVGTDFTTIGSVFGNHHPTLDHCARGGDLYIRYPDGTLKNLTAAAGYGSGDGLQGNESIAVRDPSVHWDGTRAVFSMAVGAPAFAAQPISSFWQMYEITGLGKVENPVITKVPNQPPTYNNISPCYGTDGRILFTSDRPRGGASNLYPQLDEYELAPTVSGLWSLDPASGGLFQLDHAPSGDFTPSVDSFGRVIFTRWDHLQQDQEADFDRDAVAQGTSLPFGTFNYTDESTNSTALAGIRTELFPEPRQVVGTVNRHVFNFFFPWMIGEDGSGAETINHVGRQELAGYFEASFLNDPNLRPFFNPAARYNTNFANIFLQLKEDPRQPGLYYCVDSPEFSSHASGQIMTLFAPPTQNPDLVRIGYVTHLATKGFLPDSTTGHTGHYREPLPLSDGTLVAVHATNTDVETRRGFGADYSFRLKSLKKAGSYHVPDQNLTAGLSKSVSFYIGGGLASYSGPLWELNPVEVRARPVPLAVQAPLAGPEQQIFDSENVAVSDLRDYLALNDLALIISRNVTTRDHADRQQPFNLRVAGGGTQTIGAPGKIYDIAFLEILQGDQIRGFGLTAANSTPRAGRRVLAQPLHDGASLANNQPDPGTPSSAVQLGQDGSMAAFVPARRALTWQLTGTNNAPVVRERFWLTFQPGEIRSCTSCHGVNTRDQANQLPPANPPEALRTLLQRWKVATGVAPSQAHALTNHGEPGRVSLRLRGTPGSTGHLETSADLLHWTKVRRVSTGSDGTVQLDVPGSGGSQRYYRLAE